MSVLVIVIAIGIAFWVARRKAPIEATPSYEGDVQLMALPSGEQAFPQDNIPLYAIGETFYHKDTRQKVEIIASPAIVNGEYTIRWPSGSTGHIHQSSLREFFE